MHSANSSFNALPPETLRNINQSRLVTVQQHLPPIVSAANDLSYTLCRMIELMRGRQPTGQKREEDGTYRSVDVNELMTSLRAVKYALNNLEEQFRSLNIEFENLFRYQDEVHTEGSGRVPMSIRANWYTRRVNQAIARAQNLSAQQAHVVRSAFDTIDSTRRLYRANVPGMERTLLNDLETLSTL